MRNLNTYFSRDHLKAYGLILLFFIILLAFSLPAQASAPVRIKDIVNVEAVRENQLVGYGLVVGLDGTGDDIKKAIFTRESIIGMLERLGVNTRDSSLETKNVAAVIVTAALPSFARQGTRVDVNVATLGDADSLQGGTLLATPLIGADGEVYAVAQGPVAVGGFKAQGAAETVTRGVPTSAQIANGAIVERELQFDMQGMNTITLALRNPDFTTGRRIARAINSFVGGEAATLKDPGTIEVQVPTTYVNNAVALITDIEQLRVEPDSLAKVVVDEDSGTIVMGSDVRINTVAIAQGNLTIRITETPQVSQPNPFSNLGLEVGDQTVNIPDAVLDADGNPVTSDPTINFAAADAAAQTTVVDRTNIAIDEDTQARLRVMDGGVTLQQLVDGLNALGVGPRDMITILHAIKAAGALQAEIEVI